MEGIVKDKIMNRVLVIAAHPDDEVLGMGGTIKKLTILGKEVFLLIVTDGSTSQYSSSEDVNKIIVDKKRETERAAKLLGIKTVLYGELPDMKLDIISHISINKVIENAIDIIQPDTVFTHFWGDVNKDHQAVYESTLVAVRPLVNQVVKELYCYSVPSSTEWNPCKQDTMFLPNVFVEIEKYKEKKYEAMSEYSTELRAYPHPRSIQHLKELDISVGLQVGMKATESFMCLRKIV